MWVEGHAGYVIEKTMLGPCRAGECELNDLFEGITFVL